jgi:hypothetical protein
MQGGHNNSSSTLRFLGPSLIRWPAGGLLTHALDSLMILVLWQGIGQHTTICKLQMGALDTACRISEDGSRSISKANPASQFTCATWCHIICNIRASDGLPGIACQMAWLLVDRPTAPSRLEPSPISLNTGLGLVGWTPVYAGQANMLQSA